MKVIRLLLSLLFIQGDVYSDKSFCTEQPDSIRVEKGGSVTIPCHFSYPNYITPTEVRVYWRHAKGGHCGQNQFIYNHTEKWTHENYAGRISMEGNPEKERTVTIRIQRLKETDGPMFCCRISLHYNGNKTEWQNRHGTFIKFKDQFFVEQSDVVPAVMGEDISIPCAVHNKSSDDIEEIIWRKGKSDICSNNPELLRWNKKNMTQKVGRWTLQKSENVFSIHIKNVTNSDSGQYCCEVITKLKPEEQSSAHGTQVVIADPHQKDSRFTITQTGIISANEGGSVTIKCSYTVPPDQSLLWRGVFWRAGSPTGPYAYHPSDLMVDSRYSGRTQLNGQADLQIKGVQDTDHTTYYCFVMLKFCTGEKMFNSMLRYGSGTQFGNNSTQTGILAGVGIILFLIVLCVILFILKKRGVICKKKESVKSSPSPVNHASSPPSNYDKVETSSVRSSDTVDGPEEPGGTVYAHLNVKALQQGATKRNKGDASSSDHQVLYAAVKPATDQVIYSAVR